MNYILAFILAASISLVLTPLVRKLAFRIGAVDRPGDARRIHKTPVARLGGVAMYLAFTITILVNLRVSRTLLGLLAGVTVLVIVGAIDDIRGLSPWRKLVWQIAAACLALAGGIGIISLTNPLGGVFLLTAGRFGVDIGGLAFHITPIANFISIFWLVGLVNTTNFLDGLDGLAAGVSSIAALVMFGLAIGPRVQQPEVAMIAIILAGAAIGFLPFNFHPAKIFMGDSGSYFLGLTLGLIAIYSGAKLATAALVLGFTIFDGAWTVLRRLYRHVSPFTADRRHFHHLLLEAGLSQRQAVVSLYGIAAVFGLAALMASSFAKLLLLIAVVLLLVLSVVGLLIIGARRVRQEAKKIS